MTSLHRSGTCLWEAEDRRSLWVNVLLFILISGQVVASEHNDNALPLPATRVVRFTTAEGSWLDLDLSPDGRTIIFELLGDLYKLPISGGKANRITSGTPFDALPRFSPDGRRIAFVSDRDGGDNIWTANADGSDMKRVTDGKGNLFQSLQWTPDGYLAAAKGKKFNEPDHAPFPSRDYPQLSYQIVFYDLRGGRGLPIELKPSGSAYAPTFGSDPRYMYASVLTKIEDRHRGDPATDYIVVKFDRETGVTQEVGARGGAVQPVVSPDSRWLIYGTRYENRTGLRLRNLITGEEQWLLTGLRASAGSMSSSRGAMPGAEFTPDSRAVVLYNDGRIWRVRIPSGEAAQIPFVADVEIPVGPLVRFPYRVEDETLTVAQIRGARPSPDGKHLVFSALNKLWLVDLPKGTPRRLTRDVGIGEHQPTWSPDGRFVAYVGWHEGRATETRGSLRRAAVPSTAGPALSEHLTTDNAYYEYPVYSPDGKRLLANREKLQTRLLDLSNPGRSTTKLSSTSELVWVPSQGGEVTPVLSPVTGVAMFTKDGSRIWLSSGSQLDSVRWDGSDRRTEVTAPAASGLHISPSGRQLLAIAPGRGDSQAYLVALPGTPGVTVNLANPETASISVKKMTTLGVRFAGWSADEGTIHYSLGRSFFTVEASHAASPVTSQTDVTIRVPLDKPHGTVVFRGARIVSLGRSGTIEKGDLVVIGSRIAALGEQGEITIPPHAHVIDVTGATIIPGYVDTHGHIHDALPGASTAAVLSHHRWRHFAALAYGVTTNRDPVSSADEFAYSDLVAVGETMGPRAYATGPRIDALFNITSYEDALRIVTRYKDFFGTNYIKQYGSGERQVRQWLNMAAAQKRLTADVETFWDTKRSLADAMDGYAELSHAIPLSPLYNDVIQLLAQTGISYTATLNVVGSTTDYVDGGLLYFYTRENLIDDQKLHRFVPKARINAVAYHQDNWYTDSKYVFASYAVDIKKMIAAGVNVAIGSHGDFPGPGYHWEMEMHAAGGIDPQDILRAATIGGARAIGLDEDIGSLELGKLADLQVLDRNPLEDIRNIRSMRYVVKNGRTYDSDTLDEIWPRQRKLPPMWWQE